MSLAIVVIASEKRRNETFDQVMESVTATDAEEVVCVADFPVLSESWRHYVVQPITRTTIDALVKRDVGWAATTADAVMYLCDDHVLAPGFLATYRMRYEKEDWDILCPSRYTIRDHAIIPLNMGKAEGYVGGHGGIYRRTCARSLPWSAGPHHPNWDVLHTRLLVEMGAILKYAETDLSIVDIEPGATPWR